MSVDELFDEMLELPSDAAERRSRGLVGLEREQERMQKELALLLERDALESWSERNYGCVLPAVEELARRSPLILVAGDVGCGKTTLAETFGDTVARKRGIAARVFRMSLRVRGKGAVGEMTNLVTAAFEEVARNTRDRSRGGQGPSVSVLLIDEADALAQSRELAEMHHEDRAGVNAVIRGINRLTEQRLPVLVVMCTNRIDAVDPAIRRRAALEITVARPTSDQRFAVLEAALAPAVSGTDLREIAELTGPIAGREYGYTYSDLRERLVPAALLRAFPDESLTVAHLREQLATIPPTPPFGQK